MALTKALFPLMFAVALPVAANTQSLAPQAALATSAACCAADDGSALAASVLLPPQAVDHSAHTTAGASGATMACCGDPATGHHAATMACGSHGASADMSCCSHGAPMANAKADACCGAKEPDAMKGCCDTPQPPATPDRR